VADRKKILEFALEKGPFSDVIKNFLRLLIDKNRIRAIKEIADYYSILTDKILNIARANIITARPLKDKALDKLEKALAVLTSKKVKIDMEEDGSLIGGLIIKIGDLVLDGSVRAQLEWLRVSLKRSEYN
jgi:F-type H+-transporting ATPase subunit delta